MASFPKSLPMGASIIQVLPFGEDIDAYRDLICAGMSPDDVHSPCEFRRRLEDGRLLAWWVRGANGKSAWCALAPRHGKYAPGAWHLYGVWVRPDMRRLGLAGALWEFRISLVPDGVPVTVSIQEGKAASFATAKRLGFEALGTSHPWVNLILRDRRGKAVGCE